MANRAKALVEQVLRFVLPRLCVSCHRPAPAEGVLLCLPCRGQLRRPPQPGCRGCGRALAERTAAERSPEVLCGPCRLRQPPLRLVAAWSYEGPIVAVIRALKYRRLDFLGPRLGRALADVIGGVPGPSVATVVAEPILVPIPLHWRRQLLRGYNQAELLALGIAERWRLPRTNALRRIRPTPAQARLGRHPRGRNLHRAFAVPAPRSVAGRHILLVDDVFTTGSTLAAAAQALLRAGATEVTALVAARTPLDDEKAGV